MIKKFKSETLLIMFYVIYFVWLTLLTFLTPDTLLMDYFTTGMAVFYLIFLREEWDILLFVVASLTVVTVKVMFYENLDIKIDYVELSEIPLWLPLAWSTTAVALRKFYVIMIKRDFV